MGWVRVKHDLSKTHNQAETALQLPILNPLLKLRSYSSLSGKCYQLYSATCSALLYLLLICTLSVPQVYSTCCSARVAILYQFISYTAPVSQLYYNSSF